MKNPYYLKNIFNNLFSEKDIHSLALNSSIDDLSKLCRAFIIQ